MKRGRKPKNTQMHENNTLPPTVQGDIIKVSLEITRVSNGYIVRNIEPGTKEGIMVFNGAEGHRLVSGHVLNLAIADMKEGEIINFSSQVEYTKKQS